MTMNRVLKILHFLVLSYSGVVSTLLLLKDASHRSSIDLSLVVGDFRSYLFNTKSLGLLIIFILGLCFFARDSFTFFFSLVSIILAPIAIVNDCRDDFNRLDPVDYIPQPIREEDDDQALHVDHDDHDHDHEEESHALASFKNYVDHLDTINELAVLFGPSNEDQISANVEKDKFIEQQEDKKVNNNDIEDYHDIQITFDSRHTDIYDDQFLTMVEHQVDDKVNNDIHEDQSIMKKRWGDEIFDQHHVEDIGLIDASIYYDNEVSIQDNDDTTSIIKEEVIFDHVNVNIPEEETKSLDETWKDIERLLSSQSKQSPRESMMPQTPQTPTLTPRRRKVAKLKSSSIIESRDMNEWKDKKKTLSFNEEVYLRQRGGMIRNESEDAESLNKKFDDFIAKNKQELLIQRQESHQRFLEKTSRGGGGGG